MGRCYFFEVPKPAAKKNDTVSGTDTHIVLVPSPTGTVPTPLPHPFMGVIDGALSPDVNIDNQPAATTLSTATNTPSHIPAGGPFAKPPTNRATITAVPGTVFINNKPIACHGDTALTCNDPVDAPNGTVAALGSVYVG